MLLLFGGKGGNSIEFLLSFWVGVKGILLSTFGFIFLLIFAAVVVGMLYLLWSTGGWLSNPMERNGLEWVLSNGDGALLLGEGFNNNDNNNDNKNNNNKWSLISFLSNSFYYYT